METKAGAAKQRSSLNSGWPNELKVWRQQLTANKKHSRASSPKKTFNSGYIRWGSFVWGCGRLTRA